MNISHQPDATQQALIDLLHVFDTESCIKSLYDVFGLDMENKEAKPMGYEFQIYRNLKTLLLAIKPKRLITMEETTHYKDQH